MKLLHILLSKSGKLALTTAQAVGAAAAVGVAGLAAWTLLSSPADVNPDTMFSARDEGEVVYVAGGAGSSYGSGGYAPYGEGGEVRSGIRAKMSRDMELMNLDAQRAAAVPSTELDRQETQVAAFKMDGRSAGLGMKQDAVEVGGAMGGGLDALQAQIAQIQAAAQQQGAAAGDAAQAAQAALQGKGLPSGMARANGTNLQSTPLQAGGPGSKAGGVLNGGRAGDMPDRLTAPSRKPTFAWSREAMIEEGQRFNRDNSMEGLRLASAKVAANAQRSTVEGQGIFMGMEKQGGLVVLTGETVKSEGSSSNDFNKIEAPNLSGAQNEIETYEDTLDNVQDQLYKLADRMSKDSRWLRFTQFVPGTWWIQRLFVKWFGRYTKTAQQAINHLRDQWKDTVREEQATQFADQAQEIYNAVTDFWNIAKKDKPMEEYNRLTEKYWSKTEEAAQASKNPYGERRSADALSSDSSAHRTGQPGSAGRMTTQVAR